MRLYTYNLQSFTICNVTQWQCYTVAHKHIYTHTHIHTYTLTHLHEDRLDMIPFFLFLS